MNIASEADLVMYEAKITNIKSSFIEKLIIYDGHYSLQHIYAWFMLWEADKNERQRQNK